MMETFLREGGIHIEDRLMMLGHEKLVHVGVMGQKFAKQLYHPLLTSHLFRICKVHPLVRVPIALIVNVSQMSPKLLRT